MPAKTTGENFKNVKKEDVHAYYLMEKYANRWRQKQKLVKDLCPVILWNDAPWLKKVLFNPSSRMSRQVACNMLESLCQVSIRKKEVNLVNRGDCFETIVKVKKNCKKNCSYSTDIRLINGVSWRTGMCGRKCCRISIILPESVAASSMEIIFGCEGLTITIS